MAEFYGDFTKIFGKVFDALTDVPGFIEGAADTISFILQNYENSMIILDVDAENIGSATYQEEFETALTELAEEFRSDYVKILRTAANDVMQHAMDETIDELVKLLGTGVSSLYGIVTFSIDLAMQETGNTTVAEADTDFLVQLDTYTNALSSYHDAFDAVKNGDTSGYAAEQA